MKKEWKLLSREQRKDLVRQTLQELDKLGIKNSNKNIADHIGGITTGAISGIVAEIKRESQQPVSSGNQVVSYEAMMKEDRTTDGAIEYIRGLNKDMGIRAILIGVELMKQKNNFKKSVDWEIWALQNLGYRKSMVHNFVKIAKYCNDGHLENYAHKTMTQLLEDATGVTKDRVRDQITKLSASKLRSTLEKTLEKLKDCDLKGTKEASVKDLGVDCISLLDSIKEKLEDIIKNQALDAEIVED